MTTSFGKRLRQLRESKNINVTELARITERQKQFISNLEHGHRLPPDEFLQVLASLPQLSITYNQLKAWVIESKYSEEQIGLASSLVGKILGHKTEHFINAVPLIGRCPAGDISRSDFSEYEDSYVYTYNSVEGNGIAVQIEGDSMKPKIEHSDIVIIEPIKDKSLKTGYIYLFRDEKNQFSCKAVRMKKNEPILYGLNPQAWQPKLLKDLEGWSVIGKVIEVIKHDNLLITESTFDTLDQHTKP